MNFFWTGLIVIAFSFLGAEMHKMFFWPDTEYPQNSSIVRECPRLVMPKCEPKYVLPSELSWEDRPALTQEQVTQICDANERI